MFEGFIDIAKNGPQKTLLCGDFVAKEVSEKIAAKYFDNYGLIKVPNIIKKTENFLFIDYIRGKMLVDIEDLDLYSFILNEISEWEYGQRADISLIEEKIEQLNISCLLKNKLLNLDIKDSKCHGDLSLTNIIISEENEIYFIDFHSPFLSSKILDYSKLLMEIIFGWSFFLEKKRPKLSFLESLLNLINDKTEDKIEDIYYLSIMDLYRIRPNCKNTEQLLYINKCIDISTSGLTEHVDIDFIKKIQNEIYTLRETF